MLEDAVPLRHPLRGHAWFLFPKTVVRVKLGSRVSMGNAGHMWVKGFNSPASVVIPRDLKGPLSGKIMMDDVTVDGNSQDDRAASLFAQESYQLTKSSSTVP